MGELRNSQDDALGRLRAHAYSHGQTLDELADELTSKRTPVSELND